MKKTIVLEYTGGGFGGSQPHIPARDLTQSDLDRLETEFGIEKDKVLETGLYQPAQRKENAKGQKGEVKED